jgi:surface-anchored protein
MRICESAQAAKWLARDAPATIQQIVTRGSITFFAIAALPLQADLIPLGEHVDIRWRWTAEAGWTCQAVTAGNGETADDTNTVFLPLSDKPNVATNPSISGARFTQPVSQSFAFTGALPGEPLWIAVQGTPGTGEAWPGIENNQSAGTFGSYIPADSRVSQINPRPWIRVSLVSHTPPPGSDADFSLWTTSGGVPTVWMSTHQSGTINDYYYAEGTHTHMNWGFTAPGIHKLRLTASAFAGPGATNPTGSSETFTLTFAIGPLARWQAEHFSAAELDDPAISGPAADPDLDGMKNLVEFGFGHQPRQGGVMPVSPGLGLPELSLFEEDGVIHEVLTYPRRRALSQLAPLVYQPMFAAVIADGWQDGEITTTAEDFPAELDGLNAVWEKASSRRSVGPAMPARGFARVGLLGP